MESTTTTIGEAIAIGAGLYIDNHSNTKQVQKAKEFLLSGINDDLKRSIEICRTLKTEWEQSECIDLTTLNRLKRCALTYRHNQELIALLYEHKLGENIFNYFHEIIEITGTLAHDQGCINDIEEAFSDKLRSLKRYDPEISPDEAVNTVVAALNQEQKQYYAKLRQGVTTSIERLNELAITAVDLDKELQ